MGNLITTIAQYVIIVMMILYTMSCFNIFKPSNADKKDVLLNRQITYVFVIHFLCYLTYYVKLKDQKILTFYLAQIAVAIIYMLVYHKIYPQASRLITNNMSFLLLIGYTILTRLDFGLAKKQFIISTVALIALSFLPKLIIMFNSKYKNLNKFYAIAGILFLLTVFVPGLGISNYGSRNWIKVMGISIQPMEFVKILFVLLLASMLAKSTEFKQIKRVTILAMVEILILVAEKDLGGAAIFYTVFVMMVYVATKKVRYPAVFLIGGGAAATIGFMILKNSLFYHVWVRFKAWADPWSYINNEGYQVAQSLFGIGTGGWFGFGLLDGYPTYTPVSSSDFIFSAIAEELGVIFALCLLLMCFSCFIAIVNAAMKCKRMFYKYVAFGFSICYIVQVILNIGGVIKFIPSTGVTLPLVSYGLSSVLSTLIMFSIIQGIYIIENKEAEVVEKERKRTLREQQKNKRLREFIRP